MDEPSGLLHGLDRLIHDPARLAICTALLHCESADFVFLRQVTGLTAGNLSSHLARLQQANLVTLDRQIVGRTTRTTVALTIAGSERVRKHWHALHQLERGLTASP